MANKLFSKIVLWAKKEKRTKAQYIDTIKNLFDDSEMCGAKWKICNTFLFYIIIFLLSLFEYKRNWKFQIIKNSLGDEELSNWKWVHFLNQIFRIRIRSKISLRTLGQLAFNIGCFQRYCPLWAYDTLSDFVEKNGSNNIIICEYKYIECCKKMNIFYS